MDQKLRSISKDIMTNINQERSPNIQISESGNNHFTIHGGDKSAIRIFNINGRLIRTIKNISDIRLLDMSNYSRGIYLVQIFDEKINTSHKILIK